jgi:hypothetical protein
VGETSRQRWNRDQIPEMGSLHRLSLGFLQPECRVLRRRPPGLGNRKANQHAVKNVIGFKESWNARFNLDRKSVGGVRGILP